jgi:FtsZ-binding cell division protein ZapB
LTVFVGLDTDAKKHEILNTIAFAERIKQMEQKAKIPTLFEIEKQEKVNMYDSMIEEDSDEKDLLLETRKVEHESIWVDQKETLSENIFKTKEKESYFENERNSVNHVKSKGLMEGAKSPKFSLFFNKKRKEIRKFVELSEKNIPNIQGGSERKIRMKQIQKKIDFSGLNLLKTRIEELVEENKKLEEHVSNLENENQQLQYQMSEMKDGHKRAMSCFKIERNIEYLRKKRGRFKLFNHTRRMSLNKKLKKMISKYSSENISSTNIKSRKNLEKQNKDNVNENDDTINLIPNLYKKSRVESFVIENQVDEDIYNFENPMRTSIFKDDFLVKANMKYDQIWDSLVDINPPQMPLKPFDSRVELVHQSIQIETLDQFSYHNRSKSISNIKVLDELENTIINSKKQSNSISKQNKQIFLNYLKMLKIQVISHPDKNILKIKIVPSQSSSNVFANKLSLDVLSKGIFR